MCNLGAQSQNRRQINEKFRHLLEKCVQQIPGWLFILFVVLNVRGVCQRAVKTDMIFRRTIGMCQNCPTIFIQSDCPLELKHRDFVQKWLVSYILLSIQRHVVPSPSLLRQLFSVSTKRCNCHPKPTFALVRILFSPGVVFEVSFAKAGLHLDVQAESETVSTLPGIHHNILL